MFLCDLRCNVQLTARHSNVITSVYVSHHDSIQSINTVFLSDSRCFSTKLGFCEGVVPYDVVQLPKIPGVNKYEDLKAVIPYFQTIIESGCSLRAREFICSLLEPECLPDSQRQAPPCKLNCKGKAVVRSCTTYHVLPSGVSTTRFLCFSCVRRLQRLHRPVFTAVETLRLQSVPRLG